MKQQENIFVKNLKTLRKKNPQLAERLLDIRVPGYYSVVTARSGHPVLHVMNITFHSMYDPVKEGQHFADYHLKNDDYRPGEKVAVFGLGFGYHLKALVEKNISCIVVEPRIEIVRFAMEHINLEDILAHIEIYTETDIVLESDTRLWPHQPSVKYSKSSFDRLKCLRPVSRTDHTDIHHQSQEKERLKITVVTPIYGGSLPVARYCYAALKKLGHDVELWDASIFEEPFAKALSLDVHDKNKKVLHDLFLHLISEMIVASCTQSPPDLLLALAQAPLSIKALERIKKLKIITAYWFVEDYQLMEYWRTYAPYYDFFFTIQEHGFFEELKKCGLKHCYYLPMAADPQIHRPLVLTESERQEFGSDISFMGAGYYNREKMLQGLLDYNFKIWGTGWNPVSVLWQHVQDCGNRLSTEKTVKVFNASKININLHSSVCHQGINPFGDYLNPRTFEIASCGGFQLVDRRSMLARHFTEDDEIICYASLQELRDKINCYLQKPDERLKIAGRARNRILKEHTYEHRMQELITFIRTHMPEQFFVRKQSIPIIDDVDTFCSRHPEVQSIFKDIDCKDRGVAIDEITAAIQSRSGPLEYQEVLFLLLNEFHAKFRESAA